MKDRGVPCATAARAVGVDRDVLRRAKKAKDEGREIGKPGRPRLLTVGGEAQLVSAVIEAEVAGQPLTHKRLREVVFHPSTIFLYCL